MVWNLVRLSWPICIVLFLSTASIHAASPLETDSSDRVEWQLTEADLVDSDLSKSDADILLTGSCDSAGCDCGDKVGCGKGVGATKANPCATSHKGVFYANDFSYLNDPCYKGHCLGDCLKQNAIGQNGRWGKLDVGGQLRFRYHHEIGMAQDVAGPGTLRFEDTEHDFGLTRLRLYTDWRVNEIFRVYTEGIFADVTTEELDYNPRPIDQNHGDFLNLFIDVKMTDRSTIRVGRQELLYGEQRLVSPLDWANTRRTFEGIKGMWKNGDFAVDVFYTNFVPVQPFELDEADYDISFYGGYATCNAWENASLDFYYFGYDNEKPGNTAATDFSIHTIGARLNGSINGWLYEMEGGPQFGRQSNINGVARDHSAMFATGGIGRNLSDVGWTPALWVYYDYASGDNGDPTSDFNQFNQLYPLAHKYLGFIDAVARSNIESPNVLLTMKPHKRVQLLAWYYHFMSNQAETPVPSIGGTPTQSTTSRDLGDELDLIAKFAISPRSNALIGYSHFWRGNKITAPNDADFVYLQWLRNF